MARIILVIGLILLLASADSTAIKNDANPCRDDDDRTPCCPLKEPGYVSAEKRDWDACMILGDPVGWLP